MCRMKPARVVTVDWPWKFRDNLPGKRRGAAKIYKVMKADPKNYQLPPLDKDCVMFFWRVAAMPQEALDLIRAWGFKAKSEIVWNKTTKHGKRAFGMGHYFRGEHEVCILATRGKPPAPRLRNVRSTFTAMIGAHSEKPAEFYRIVRSMYDGPRVAVFERKKRVGFKCYGDELK